MSGWLCWEVLILWKCILLYNRFYLYLFWIKNYIVSFFQSCVLRREGPERNIARIAKLPKLRKESESWMNAYTGISVCHFEEKAFHSLDTILTMKCCTRNHSCVINIIKTLPFSQVSLVSKSILCEQCKVWILNLKFTETHHKLNQILRKIR